ncbi:hypothetical protein B0H17DRAFT_317093 [Mycena rosella]|uniref:F-box domain-containing protein n=1 Tax=Mycena rosella TaxID=1033263 RepID=A0AAD7DU26_MYCRO|nr:hypothetical protein B0H17DRAFT_317093 [Mycena rosella]
MEEHANPLNIPELLEHCMGFLRDLAPDLKASALVSHSWASAAQPHLFREVAFGSSKMERRWPRLDTILNTSPHLIRHIHRLYITCNIQSPPSIEMFAAICNFPFTRLSHVSVSQEATLSLPTAIAMQELLSLPTLTHVKIECHFTQPSIFRQIWDRCSPSVMHLDLSCTQAAINSILNHDIPVVSSVRLESLQTATIGIRTNRGGWTQTICPLNISGLKVLSIGPHKEIIRWQRMLPALGTLLALNLYIVDIVDLSLFPTLVLLRVFVSSTALQTALDIFSTIAPSSCIRKIVIMRSIFLASDVYQQLDSGLSDLPISYPLTVELEMDNEDYNHVIQFFPRLSSRNLLRRTDVDLHWFENFSVRSLSL